MLADASFDAEFGIDHLGHGLIHRACYAWWIYSAEEACGFRELLLYL
jgi:hypothetical protein